MPTNPTLDDKIAALRAMLTHFDIAESYWGTTLPALRSILADLEASRSAPLLDGEPTPGALTTAQGMRCADDATQPALGTWQLKLVARALDAFARSAVEKERARCAMVVDCGGPNGCGEWATSRKKGGGYCMAHEGACAHELAALIRSGETP